MKAVIFGSTLAGIMGVAILSPAFPEVQRALNLNDFQVGLLITVFTLPGIFFAPLMGYLADKYGRGILLSASLILFSLSGFACAFADYSTMLLLRFVQGVGGSALTSLAVTLIGDIFEGIERAKMLGYNASVLSMGLAFYPLLGGILAEIDWRLPFIAFISALPIGLMAIRIKSRGHHNKFRLEINRDIIVAFVLGCAVFIFTYGVFYLYVPLTLENKFRASPILRGLVQSSTLIFTALVATRLGTFVSRFGVYRTISFGFLGYSLSLLLIPLSPDILTATISTTIYGFGHGTVLPALQNLLVERTSLESRATVIATYNSMIRVGQTVGPIFASLIGFNSYFLASLMSLILFAITFKFWKG
ncbi:MFS transporter [Archaeoglobus profundus]|uniref:Major facilitator superfamily MFS_1 n=1 Tax=Archaeoglobus profundus (strain DSM 5631 / JCM 9629 / NBRC 100127 / Av18) TaxID=572546 RepID=D2RIA4_ARCPA|nr:MFS transporter [Archaeoglobus profundus]ADB58029.1 major facilitator superfamily MFS_1 [Archaeoglobus profundus DSM 5631]